MRYLLIFLASLNAQIAESKTLCYNLAQEIACGDTQFPRQAGDYAENAQNRFSYAYKDIVLDNNSQLLWLQCINRNKQGTCPEQVPMSWEQAGQACANIQQEHLLWRLPTVIELNSLIDLEARPIKINTHFFEDTQASAYWTSTRSLTYKTQGSRAWFIHFAQASIFDASIDSKHFVRCVSKNES